MSKVYDDLKGESLEPFYASFKSEETKENYAVKLRHFLNQQNETADSFVALAKKHPTKAEALLVSYIAKRKQEKVSGSTISMARDAIKLLLEMNDVKEERFNWKKINRLIPPAKRHGPDRPPTPDEIRKILLHVSLRLKCVILLLVSSGMRIGSLSWLRWQDLEPVEAGGFKFAKLRIYAGEPEEYTAFITPETYQALLEYKKIRESKGEKVTGKSPVIARIYGRIQPKDDKAPINPKVFRNVIGRIWKKIGEREVTNNGHVNRYDFKQVHGFRKFFKSECERHIKSIYVEMLMGHSVGVSNSYMKPSLKDMAEEYAKAIPYLSVLEQVKDERAQLLKQALASVDLLVDNPYERERIRRMIETADPKMEYADIMARVREMLRKSANDPLLKWAKEPKSLEQSSKPTPEADPPKKRISCKEEEVQKYLDMGYAPKFEMRNGAVVMEYET